MGATASIIVAALGLASTLAPYVAEGVKALVTAIQTHEAAGKKLSLTEIEAMAAEHGVDLEHCASLVEAHTAAR